MAVAFEISDMILSEEQAEHINFRHVTVNDQSGSKFTRSFNLTATLALLTRKTWVSELEGNYEIIERGFKHGHGEYYIYVFRMEKVIGYDPYGLSSREICIYFSWKAIYGDKLAIISAYPFSRCYYEFLKSRRLGFCWLPNSFHKFYFFIYFLVYYFFSLKAERSEKVCFRYVFPEVLVESGLSHISVSI